MPALVTPAEITKSLKIRVLVPEIKPFTLLDVDLKAPESLLESVVVILIWSLLN